MTLRFIGDLHLTHPPADDFTGPDSVLIARLDGWIEDGDTIVLPGDIVDLWQAKFKDIYRAHKPLLRKLSKCAKWIIGNHDWDMLFVFPRLKGLVVYEELVIDGVRIVHGSHLDPILQRIPRLARLVSWAVGWLERRVHKDVDVWASGLFKWLTRTGRYGSNKRYARALVKEVKERFPDVHTIIFGHTHKKWAARIDGIDVINAGCWVNGKQDSVTIELPDEALT